MCATVTKEVLTVVFDLWTRSTRELCKVFTSMSDVGELLWIQTLCQIIWKTVPHPKVWIAIKLTP